MNAYKKRVEKEMRINSFFLRFICLGVMMTSGNAISMQSVIMLNAPIKRQKNVCFCEYIAC